MQLAEESELDIQNFCDIFCELLSRLDPNSQVWCAVDGISFFETSLHGCCHRLFHKCVTNAATIRKRAGSVKFLLGSPVKDTRTRDAIYGNSRIKLRARNSQY